MLSVAQLRSSQAPSPIPVVHGYRCDFYTGIVAGSASTELDFIVEVVQQSLPVYPATVLID